MFYTYGREVGYAASGAGQERVYNWLRENPHRLNLAEIALLACSCGRAALALNRNESAAHAEGDGFGSAVRAEFCEYLRDVEFRGVLGDA